MCLHVTGNFAAVAKPQLPQLQYMAGYLMSKLVKILQTKGGRMKVQGKMTPLFKPGRPMMTMTIPMTKLLWGPKCPERGRGRR